MSQQDNTQEILRTLITTQLDVADDSHWTENGLPNPDVVYGLMGSPAEIEIGQIAAYIEWAAPGFKRESVKVAQPAAEEIATETTTEVPVVVDGIGEIAPVDLSGADIDEINEEVRKAEEILAAAKAKHASALAAQDKAIEEAKNAVKETPIQDYLERQKENLVKRAENVRFLRENQDLLKDVLKTKSPIDAALSSRKRTR